MLIGVVLLMQVPQGASDVLLLASVLPGWRPDGGSAIADAGAAALIGMVLVCAGFGGIGVTTLGPGRIDGLLVATGIEAAALAIGLGGAFGSWSRLTPGFGTHLARRAPG